jgi:hypothetical protein
MTEITMPAHISFSSMNDWLDCGHRYYLGRMTEVEDLPQMMFIGGKVVHSASETYDRFGGDLDKIWNDEWTKALDGVFAKGFSVDDIKINIGNEDVSWWYENGRKMLDRHVRFSTENSVLMLPDGTPAIELDLSCDVNGVEVKMYADRLTTSLVNGEVSVTDIKTGRKSPTNPLQLAFYRYGVKQKYGIDLDYGQYWMVRTGKIVTKPLSPFTDAVIEGLVAKFDHARKALAFVPNVGSCTWCSFKPKCEFGRDMDF